MRHSTFNKHLKSRFSEVTGIPQKVIHPQVRFIDKDGIEVGGETQQALANRKSAHGTFMESLREIRISPELLLQRRGIQLTPEEQQILQAIAGPINYSQATRLISHLRKEVAKELLKTLEHEERHGLQSLTRSRRLKLKGEEDQVLAFHEPTNFVPRTPEEQRLYEDSIRKNYSKSAAEKMITQLRLVTGLYQRHGVDVILLLWITPPSRIQAAQLGQWEARLIKNRILKKKGGLTKKGLTYCREKSGTEDLIKVLGIHSPYGTEKLLFTKDIQIINAQRRANGLKPFPTPSQLTHYAYLKELARARSGRKYAKRYGLTYTGQEVKKSRIGAVGTDTLVARGLIKKKRKTKTDLKMEAAVRRELWSGMA